MAIIPGAIGAPAQLPSGTQLTTATTLPAGSLVSTTSTGAFTYVSQAPRRNQLINGNMDFWQRGTSFTISNTNGYTADRLRLVVDSAHTTTATRSTDVPTLAESGYQSVYSALFTNGTGAATAVGGFTQVQHRLEGYNLQELHGRPARLSFWVKASITGDYSLGLGNGSTRAYLTKFTINAANTWELKAIDLTFDTTGTWIFDNSLGLYILINLSLGTNFQASTTNSWIASSANGPTGCVDWAATTGATFRIAQMSLCPGDFSTVPAAAVPFSRTGVSIQAEFDLCQRYFQVWGGSGLSRRISQVEQSSNNIYFSYSFAPMRAIGVVNYGVADTDISVANLQGVSQTGFTFSTYTLGVDAILIQAAKTTHGLTGGASLYLITTVISNSAEL